MRDYLVQLRNKAGLSQKEVANRIGCSAQNYCRIENGKRQQKMAIDIIQKLAKVFDVSVEWIIEQETALKNL